MVSKGVVGSSQVDGLRFSVLCFGRTVASRVDKGGKANAGSKVGLSGDVLMDGWERWRSRRVSEGRDVRARTGRIE